VARSRKASSRKITIGDVARILDTLAPPELAQEWDNVGLLVGDRSSLCRRVLLCIDLTPPVLDEAIKAKADLLISYHPPIFKPVNRLLADSGGTDAFVHQAIARGIAIYSPHTALDAAPGGTNDVLAVLCGLKDIEPFEYVQPPAREFKIVTFVPAKALDNVAQAMFQAGAGRIGDYEQCSYRLEGQGTFFGTETTDPKVGRKGRLEKVAETRLEMVVDRRLLPEVIDVLLRSHPYEEPACDVYPLAAAPTFGIGRVGDIPGGTTLGKLADKLRRATQSKVVMLAGSKQTKIRRVAVCVGAAGRLPLERARSADCDAIVTGEMHHHDALTLLRLGKSAIALGHWESERPVLGPLADRLSRIFLTLRFFVSETDTGPFIPGSR
jgi:dinuclear metal center YbgI/SA1388 family protein